MLTIPLLLFTESILAASAPDCTRPREERYRSADTVVVAAVGCATLVPDRTPRDTERLAAGAALAEAVRGLPVRIDLHEVSVRRADARDASVMFFRFLYGEAASWVLVERSERVATTQAPGTSALEIVVNGEYRFVRDDPVATGALRLSVSVDPRGVRPWLAPDLPADPVDWAVSVSDSASIYAFTVEDDTTATLQLPSCAARRARVLVGGSELSALEGSDVFAAPDAPAMALLIIAVRGEHPPPPIVRPPGCYAGGRYLPPRPLSLTTLFTWYTTLPRRDRARATAIVPVRRPGDTLP